MPILLRSGFACAKPFGMGTPDVIGTAEACEMLGGIERSTLIRRIARGELEPYTKLPGPVGQWLFDRAEVERHRDELAAKAAS